MFIRDLRNAGYFSAGDHTALCELLHPDRADTPPLPYSIAHATVAPGCASLPHRLRTSVEVYFILAGTGLMSIDDEQAEVGPGQAIYIPPDALQSIRNTGSEPLTFLAIVSPPWQAEDEEIGEFEV